MRRRVAVLSVAIVLTAVLSAFGVWHTTAQAGEEGASGERKVLYWKSPMNPTFISKAPGKDAMGMDLVPVYEGETPAGEAGTVRIDPVTIHNIGVKTALVQRKGLAREIRTVGRISYDEKKMRRISPKIGGWVERQTVNFTGQVVEKGEPLLEIYSPELVATQEEYLIALHYRGRLKDSSLKEAVAGSEGLVKAAEARLRYWDIGSAQIKALRERGEITRTMVLHAPFKGIILEKDVVEGGYVKPGQGLYGIADISTVWVYADVYEYEVPWLEFGQDATMTLAYRPGQSYRGKVVYIYPYLKKMTRTLQVRMEFPNTDNFDLKPDMWANVTIHARLSRESLAIPVQAVIRTGQRDIALVALEEGRFAPRELRLGAEVGDELEVLDGLQAGDRVVTSAQFLINSESSLQSAISKMIEPASDEERAEGGPGADEGAMPEMAPADPPHAMDPQEE